jgi:hypothetical protein
MNRRLAFVAVLAACLTAVGVSAQNRPDFSGRWRLVADDSTPPNTWALGQDFAITQDSTTLTFERPTVAIHFSSDGRSTSTPGEPVKITYNLNGPETRPVAPPAVPAARPASATLMTMSVEESASTATWAADHLVLVSSSTLKTTQPNREPAVTRVRQTVRNVLSLDKDGTLVVEHLITVDPPISNPNVAQPVPIRSVYRKTPR